MAQFAIRLEIPGILSRGSPSTSVSSRPATSDAAAWQWAAAGPDAGMVAEMAVSAT
jgi:hypothetical protein